MRFCKYIYCQTGYSEDLETCPCCGYPVDEKEIENLEFTKSKLPEISGSIIDMHQIIPKQPGMIEVQIQIMEYLGIQKALLQSVPTKVSSIFSNTDLLELKNTHADKFLISHFLDPRHPFALKRLGQYKERGVNVIKLLPCLGYEPDHPKWDKFWQKMERLDQVAMVHTGFITARHKKEEFENKQFLSSKYGDPLFFDIIARKFPGLKIILCHTGGTIWTESATQMINQHDNVWGDISGFGLLALKKMLNTNIVANWDKLFWGNDSSPFSYPYNLNILLYELNKGNRQELIPKLLFNNASNFLQEIAL
ncbi:amidohydrolase family protein [Bacteroidota bacterium]